MMNDKSVNFKKKEEVEVLDQKILKLQQEIKELKVAYNDTF